MTRSERLRAEEGRLKAALPHATFVGRGAEVLIPRRPLWLVIRLFAIECAAKVREPHPFAGNYTSY